MKLIDYLNIAVIIIKPLTVITIYYENYITYMLSNCNVINTADNRRNEIMRGATLFVVCKNNNNPRPHEKRSSYAKNGMFHTTSMHNFYLYHNFDVSEETTRFLFYRV
jgi:hypothetical protein